MQLCIWSLHSALFSLGLLRNNHSRHLTSDYIRLHFNVKHEKIDDYCKAVPISVQPAALLFMQSLFSCSCWRFKNKICRYMNREKIYTTQSFFLDYELSYSTCIIKFDSCVDQRFGPVTGIYSLIFKIVFLPLFFERELIFNYPDMTRKDLPFAAIPYSVPIFICKKIVVRLF